MIRGLRNCFPLVVTGGNAGFNLLDRKHVSHGKCTQRLSQDVSNLKSLKSEERQKSSFVFNLWQLKSSLKPKV